MVPRGPQSWHLPVSATAVFDYSTTANNAAVIVIGRGFANVHAELIYSVSAGKLVYHEHIKGNI